MESHFFAYIYRLRFIERWSLMRNVVKENVAEHTFHVALLTHMLCTIANEVFHKQVPTDNIVSMALFHDLTEVFTGDVPTPVKHHNANILANFRELEQMAAERMAHMVPAELQAVYNPLILEKVDPELSIWIKAADLLDAYIKCVTEEAAGNREFVVAKVQTEQKLRALGLPEVDYFLTHFAPSLQKTLDELS
ncbi:5'-deoxynucleotidase [Effusibacillus lacus]|uniref:5'-deoxynucleotidase n=1 Tax=Effusibacillus lacus TaxID=1348429 RepID=A0A292YSX1_9BACL|nr:5'-deoxynucleotidase [Effusibacillus lacus]TCS74907.1 5'-deoxynucleotidase [Effusibacillus lacus]GAX91580.1 5'-deoxynucleotidase [Effusibacillus lacus]